MAFVPHGTTFSFNEQVVAELTEINGPGISVDETEVTSHDSNWWKEFLPGLIEGGEVTLTGNYVPSDTGQAALRTAMLNQTVDTWEIIYPNGYGSSGDGFITGFEPNGPSDGSKSEISITLRTTGEVSEVTPAS